MTIKQLEEILSEPREESQIVFPIGLAEIVVVEKILKEKNLKYRIEKITDAYFDRYALIYVNFEFTQKQILKAAGL